MLGQFGITFRLCCLGILIWLGNASYAQDSSEGTSSQETLSANVSMLLEEAEDADIEKVRVFTREHGRLYGYIVAVDREALYILTDYYDSDTDAAALHVLPLSDVQKVTYDESVGVFPLFTLLVPALSVGIAEGIKHDGYNAVLIIVMLPVGMFIDGIIGLFDEDESWYWTYLEGDTKILREHALFPEGIPQQYGDANTVNPNAETSRR